MALTDLAHGTKTLTGGSTEDTVEDDTAGGTYVTQIDLSAMVNGDVIILRVYTKPLTGGTLRVLYYLTFANVQAEPIIQTGPVPSKYEYKVTMTQTAGTGRACDWVVYTL
jgi:hypothetical protein